MARPLLLYYFGNSPGNHIFLLLFLAEIAYCIFTIIRKHVRFKSAVRRMAENGELYALDMGAPVRILDLAENMIRLSGLEPYEDIDIIETGLRPGEKLYEELLIKSEELDKTSNDMIYVERDKPVAAEEVEKKLQILNVLP